MANIPGELFQYVTDRIQLCQIEECHVDGKLKFNVLTEKLVNNDESGSITIIGPKVSCKLVLDSVLNSDKCATLTRVNLHGMLHSDEKIVSQEIERQLKVELKSADDDENFSIADRLQNVLATVSKRKNCKHIVFILNEFDQFTSSTHQNFLYNILDKTQAGNSTVPILVVCVSNRIDVVELLEKRVRSRLSQREIHLFNNWTYDQYIEYARSLLSCNDDQFPKIIRRQWNLAVNGCLEDKNVSKMLRNQYYKNNGLESLKEFLLIILNFAKYDQQMLKIDYFSKAEQIFSIDSTELLLKDLSQLDFCVILAAMHCQKRYPDDDYLNFEMIFSEYREFAKKSKTVFPKALVRETLEKLEECQIFVSKSEPRQDCNPVMTLYDFRLVRLQSDPARILEFIRKSPDCSIDVKNWAKNV